jgi:hypothetical protein
MEGLIQGYNSDQSKSRRKQREIHQEQLPSGNKAKLVAAIRATSEVNFNFQAIKLDRPGIADCRAGAIADHSPGREKIVAGAG